MHGIKHPGQAPLGPASVFPASGAPTDPTFLLHRSVANVICSVVFGERFDYSDSELQELLDLMQENARRLDDIWVQVEPWRERGTRPRGPCVPCNNLGLLPPCSSTRALIPLLLCHKNPAPAP